MARRPRKQKVSLRFKRREQLKTRLRTVGLRGAALVIVMGLGASLVSGSDTFLSRFILRHTPQVDLSVPPCLDAGSFLNEVPRNHFYLWFPGSGVWLEKRLTSRNRAVRAIRVERLFETNRIRMQVEPRVPLVMWNGQGFDQDGILFAVPPLAWPGLPRADFPSTANKQALSRWLARLASLAELWPQVAAIHEDAFETMELTLKTGTVVTWGALETDSAARKAQVLLRVLDDAHRNLGGTARADLRFFEQGRIIVLPKGVRGD